MKSFFFRLSLTIFLRLQICKAITAIFWQSASYVLLIRVQFLYHKTLKFLFKYSVMIGWEFGSFFGSFNPLF